MTGIDKAPLRARLRAQRLAFAPSAPAIAPPPTFLDRLADGGIIASYLPMAGEADPARLAEAALDRGYRLALPHVTTRAAPMRFLAWTVGDPLDDGPFGLLQPRADSCELNPDIVLTPLIGFDRAGNRLGQGAGYYDRAFARLAAVLRIGVAWSMQQIDTLPTDPWDVPLHGIVTERGWIDPEPTA
ncbi:MAG: 5-formyltetrahydrofolate cyclo-ligase [Sphingomonas sp. 28-66-16]|nr:MAG: 5-formyltetrahydrofolate cyclo-ligase [Sphingomonas sp. 28-66-16]